jgi:hypothetical protein
MRSDPDGAALLGRAANTLSMAVAEHLAMIQYL